MDNVLGIDLGTTCSLAAYFDDGLHFIPLEEERIAIPSIVEFSQQKVGSEALLLKKAVFSSKIFLVDENSAQFLLAKEAASVILNRIKNKAEAFLKATVNKVVITVPAYFNDVARKATREAASEIGWEVLRLLNEPTAAALAYAYLLKFTGVFGVYDLGGGTFDVSVMRLEKDFFQVISTVGDVNLGGDNVDYQILKHWRVPLTIENKLIAQSAKEALFSLDSVTVDLGEGKRYLTRDQLKEIALPLFKRTEYLLKKVLGQLDQPLDGIIMVGGSSKLFGLQEFLAQNIPSNFFCELDPEKVVAMGAAIHAYNLENKGGGLLIDVVSLALGIETLGGNFDVIVEADSPLPVAKAQDYTTYVDNQEYLQINIYQGNEGKVKDCKLLGKFELGKISPKPAGACKIRVIYRVNTNGILEVEAFEIDGEAQQKIVLRNVC